MPSSFNGLLSFVLGMFGLGLDPSKVKSFLNTSNTISDGPNFVFILVDDQDLRLGSMDRMDNVQNLMVNEGTNFMNHYAHVSLCCPSRAAIWMGRHSHNTNITTVNNRVPGGAWQQIFETELNDKYLPVWLQEAGYNTYYAGKLYNGMASDNYCGHDGKHCAGGLSASDFLVDPFVYRYYDSTFQHSVGNQRDGGKIVTGYSTDIIADYTLGYIDEAVAAGKPFFAVAAPIAPHTTMGYDDPQTGEAEHHPVPKIEYEHLYSDIYAPMNPNFNPSNRTGVNGVWQLDQLNDTNVEALHEYFRYRQRALKSVDDMVGSVIQKLTDLDVLNNTYIIYTSDNGYHIGQHRLQAGKQQCFEEDVNVPLVVRGPKIGKGMTSDIVTGHVDLVPTILNIAGIEPNPEWQLDGEGLTLPMLTTDDIDQQKSARGEHVNLEFWGEFHQEGRYRMVGQNEGHLQIYKALRVRGAEYNIMYSVWCQNASHELYDMSWDPYQMTNLHPSAPASPNAYDSGMTTVMGHPIPKLLHRLDALVLVLKTCKMESCRRPWAQLHPEGKVTSLAQAMDEQYDGFYEKLYGEYGVGFEQCYGGLQASLYDVQNERPNFEDVPQQLLNGMAGL